MTEFSAFTLRATSFSLVSCLVLLAGCRTPKTWTTQPQSTPPPPELGSGQDDSQDFNVVWDKTSANKSPLNPQWGSQKRAGKLPPIACSSDSYKCTNQSPVMDSPTGLNGLFCSAAAGGSSFYGHADWGVAEYQGAIGWYNFNFWDGDYDWVLKAENLAGVTDSNFPQSPHDPQFIELEFDSRETAPHFGDNDNWWWPGLTHKAWDGVLKGTFDDVDTYLHPETPSQAKKFLACGVVTGVFGLDCDHGCRSEVHPVYTLALQTDENPQTNQWAVFVRNWGAGGFCSGWNDELNASRMEVLLPVTSSSGGPEVTVEQFAGTAGVGCPTYGYVAGKGEELSFDLPAADTQGMAVMTVTLKWPSGADTMHCSEVDVNELRKLRGDIVSGASETDAEGQLVRAMRAVGMGPKPGGFTRDISQPYLMNHPAKPGVQKMMMQNPTRTQNVCPATERPLEMKLAQPAQEHPRKKLAPNAAGAARNEATFAALCSEYARQNKAAPPELQKVCKDKRVKSK